MLSLFLELENFRMIQTVHKHAGKGLKTTVQETHVSAYDLVIFHIGLITGQV